MHCDQIPYTKEEITLRTRAGGSNLKELVDQVIENLSKCKVFLKTVVKYVLDNKGNVQDAEDVLQEGLAQVAVSLYENKYQADSSIENYAFGVCKFKWNNRRRKNSRLQYPESEQWLNKHQKTTPGQVDQSLENEEMIWSIIGKMDEDCKKLLKLVYEGFNYKTIGERLSFAEQTVKNKISNCRRKLRKFLNDHPALKDYFTS